MGKDAFGQLGTIQGNQNRLIHGDLLSQRI